MNSDESRPPSLQVVLEVARREGAEPADLRPPLWSAVDPEALDRLVLGSESVCAVRFRYKGYRVAVEPCGTISLERGPNSTSAE